MFRDFSNSFIGNYVEYLRNCSDYYNFTNKATIHTMNKAYKETAFKIEGEYYNGKV